MALQMAGNDTLAPMTPPKTGAPPMGQPPQMVDGTPPPVQGGLPQAAQRPRLGAPASPALPIGAPKPQTAPTSQAQLSPHILTHGASGAANPWMAPSPAGDAPPQGASPLPLATGTASPYASVSANTPGSNTDYTNKTITPGAGVDRLALAKSNFENFRDSTEPEYQAVLREAGQSGAAAGQVGSGMLRGRLGDIGLSHARDLQHAQTGFLNDATNGSIEDNYRNIGIAQQQQGFQQGQQESAFGQGITQQQIEELLRSGQFGRSATMLGLGNQGNPSDIALQLAGIYGKQSGDAGQAAGSLLGNSAYGKYLKPGAPPQGGTPYDVNDPNQNIYAGMPS